MEYGGGMLSESEARLIGGSDTGAVLRVSPYGGRLELYARCALGVRKPETPEMRRGTALERTGKCLYAAMTGWDVVVGESARLHGLPSWARASLDGIVRGDGMGVLEVKTCTTESLARYWGPDGSDAVPAHYAVQAQWYAGWGARTGVADSGWCDVAVLAAPESTLQALAGWARAAGGLVPPEEVLALPGVEFRRYRLHLDEEVFRWEVEASERFWTDHVVPRRPPADEPMLPGDVSAVEALAKATEAGEALRWESLGAAERELVARWAEAKRALKEAEAAEGVLTTRLRLLLAGASGVVGLPADLGSRIDHKHQRDGKRPLVLRGGGAQ